MTNQQGAPEALRQILLDPENQPNQYGVQFLMHGPKMAFKIGNRQFCLDYEPTEPGEFEFMRDALIDAFSIFTPDVKIALRTQQPAPATQPAPQQPCPTCAALARTVMLDQVSFDRKPDCYGIRQVTDDEGVEEWEDIRTSPDVAREEANDMMATGRGEIYEVVPLWTTPPPSPTAQADSQPAPATWLTDPAPTPEREFAEWLNERRGFPVSAVFHEIMHKFAARAPAPSVLEDAALLDWLDQNIFFREMDEWDKTHGGRGSDNMWVMFAPKGAQGSARKILDAARKQGANHDHS